MNGGFYPANGDGGQGEAVRVPLADGALVPGASAPARAYIPELLPDVLDGRINPGRVLDYETDLNGISDAYAAMDERRAIKSLVRVGSL
jgi:threonine dehydrogenase-like Zn-dependent dehydrogenase